MDAPVATSQPIVLAHESPFAIGPIEVRPETCELVGGDKKLILEPRVMQVLVALHQADGHVVSRDDLLARCWSGRIVGDDAIHRVISRLRHEADSSGGHFRIETITKVGYRLIETGVAATPQQAPAKAIEDGIDRRKLLIGTGGIAAVIAAGVGIERWRNPPLPEAARLKIEEGERLWNLGTIENFAAAQAAFNAAASLAPDHAEPWGALALSYAYQAQTGNPGQATEAYRNSLMSMARANAIEPGNANAMAARAALDFSNRKVPLVQADGRITDALRRHPEHAVLVSLQSYFLPQVGRYQDALRLFERWLERESDLPAIPAAAREYLLFNVGRTDEANQTMNRLLERWPRHVSVWFTSVKILMYSGRYDRALAMLDDVGRRPVGIPERNFELTRKQVRALANFQVAGEDAVRSTIDSARKGTGFAENAILFLAKVGRVDDAMTVARALYLNEGYRIGAQRFTQEQGQFDNRRRRTAVLFERATEALRRHPQFTDLTTRIGLEDYWRASGTKPDYRV